jgi:type II secretory pathway component PulM
MSRAEIQSLISECTAARDAGASSEQLRTSILPEAIQRALRRVSAREFLEWIREDREFGYYYYDAQQSGVCAKPQEAAALILEQIALDALE